MISPELDLILCVLAPFAAAAAAPLLHRVFDQWTGLLLALVPVLICVHLLGFVAPVADGQTFVLGIDWIPSLELRLDLKVDGLSLIFATLISAIGALILIYAGSYLKGHPHQGRFLGFMLAFMGAMLGLVLANNTLALYGFWELTSVTSFLLIGFDHTRPAARRAAIQALVLTNIGGLALLTAAVALRLGFGTWDIAALSDLHGAVQGSPIYPLVLAAICLAAFTKSAQAPFHFWLPAAMEAPTPVSAYLHSATMVQGGVYLVARMLPVLGGTTLWTTALVLFGGMTLLWGSVSALRQTDLKQLLAQSTVASLGMLVLLLGIGTEAALAGAVVYFVAHALYKATLFLVAGVIDKKTGARDVTLLGGLRSLMPVTFIIAAVAALSMIGLPPALGFLAKEEAYAAAMGANWTAIVIAVLVLGNVLMGAVGLLLALKPFFGPLLATPKEPREGSPALLLGPFVLAALGILAGWATAWFAATVTAPAVGAIAGHAVELHAPAGIDLRNPALHLSLVTWVLAGAIYWRIEQVRTVLRDVATRIGWTFEAGFDAAMFGLVRLSGAVTRFLYHGRLELYLIVVFAAFALTLLLPFLLNGGWPSPPAAPALTIYEWGAVGLAALGTITVLLAHTRLFGIVALGVQGLSVSLLYMLFGAPDLSFTQFMVEILSVVIFALVMTRLRLDARDPREFEDLLRDGGVALLGGAGITVVLLKVLERPFDDRLSTFFAEHSAAVAHGRNIVNVILVDFRGLDTLGEASVIMGAGIAILALVRRRGKTKPRPPAAQESRMAGAVT